MWVRATTTTDEWVRCGACGHKLFKVTDERYKNRRNRKTDILEVKCHSCKELNRW